MKIARNLAVLLLLGIMLVLGVALAFAVRREVALFETGMKRDHQVLGQALAVVAAKTWQTNGESGVRELLADVNLGEDSLRTDLVWPSAHNSNNALVERLQQHEIVQREVPVRDSYPSLVTWIRIPRDGAALAAIEIEESTEARHRYVLSTVFRSIVTASGIAMVTWVIAVLVGGVVVAKRVSELGQFARRIGTGDVTSRVVDRGNDELTELAVAMNGMTEQLQDAQESVRHASQGKLKALEQLRHAERLATVGKLASGIAHELGTPLNVVSGRAKMILRSRGISEFAANNARIVAEQSEKMTGIIKQLLGFARAGESRKQSSDLRLLVEQAVHLLTPMARKKSVEIALEIPIEPVVLDVDQGQIHQVLANLLVNGIYAMQRAGSVSVRLELGWRSADESAVPSRMCAIITVCDQGLGIPEAILPHIFEPFFTTKGVGEGTGLGLSVAWGIVQEHGGQIRARNRETGGAEFTVDLPISIAGRS